MSEPFLGQIILAGFNFPPRGFAKCDGQILPITQNQSLFSLLGTTYGGDGRTTFGLPDLRGRTPLHLDNGHPLGQKAGVQDVPLSLNQMPLHDHTARASATDGNVPAPGGGILSRSLNEMYRPPGASPTTVAMRAGSITNEGDGLGHENMQPFLILNFVIALTGVFPSRN